MSRGRWVLACIGCMAVVPLLAASAAAGPAYTGSTWAYQTWYYGKLHKKVDKTFTVAGGTAPQKHETFYRFMTVEVETFKLRSGQVTSESKLQVYVLGFAGRTEYHFEQNKPVVDKYSCLIRSDPKPVTNTTSFGSTAQPIPVADDPLVQISWSIPIPLAQNTAGVKWQVEGSKKCNLQGDYTPGAIGYIDSGKVPDKVDEAYNGNARIRYFTVQNKLAEWTKEFNDIRLSQSSVVQGAQTSATFDLDAEVHFRAFADERFTKAPVNKIGALLLNDGIHALVEVATGAYDPSIESRVGQAAPPDVVLVPGMGTGDVQLDVNATIVPKSSPLRQTAAAAKDVLIARGTKHLARDAPFLLKLVQTPVGKALLAKKPDPLKGHLVLRLKPKGSTKWLTKSVSSTWLRKAP